ncbi:MAG: CehA/McbA family metallohydrolase [Lachnospirales bacterium]
MEYRLTNPMETSAQYPVIRNFKNKVYVIWQNCVDCEHGKKDIVSISEVADDKLGEEKQFIRDGQVLRPTLLETKEKLYAAWSETLNDQWAAYISEFDGSIWTEPQQIITAGCISDVKLVEYNECIWLFYSELSEKGSAKYVQIKGDEVAKEVCTMGYDNFRPNPIVGGDGNLYVFFDGFNGQRYSAFVSVWENAKNCFNTIELRDTDGFCTALSIAKSDKGVICIWNVIGRKSHIKYVCAEFEQKKFKPVCIKKNTELESNFWHLSASLSIEGRYFALNYGRGILMKKWDGNSYGAPFVVTPNILQKFSQRASVTVNNNKIYVAYQNASGNGHTWTRNAHIMLCVISEDEFIAGVQNDFLIENATFNKAVSKDKEIAVLAEEELEEFKKAGLASYQGMNYYFGDIHGQSTLSDGLGEIDQYFHFNRYTAMQDFTALSDHDAFPDVITPAEWELMISYSNYFNNKENFATLIGYEWTSNEFRYDYGHKNIYFKGDRGNFYPCVSQCGYSPDKLYETFKDTDCLIIPHHMGAVWSIVLASTDWTYHSVEKQRVCEVLSRHAIFETDHDESPYTKNVQREEANSLRNVLKRGYRIGFLGGSDSHQMEAGVEGGITCVISNSLNRADIYEGINQRQVYATTGARILAQFEINGSMAGSEIKVATREVLNIKGHILGTDEIKSVQVISNDNIIREWKDSGRNFDFDFEIESSDTAYYYLRIEQKDEHIALVSPIWVD